MARVIIAGDRNETELSLVRRAVAEAARAGVVREITEVVSGGARGVDTLGEVWAYRANIPCTVFTADWARQGEKDMIAQARKAGLPVFVYEGDGVS